MAFTKKNGKVLSAHSKKDKCKTIKPKIIFSEDKKRSNNLVKVNTIYTLQDKKQVPNKIKKILKQPRPTYVSKSYLIKDTLVLTKDSTIIKVTKKDKKSGTVYGMIVERSQ
jgi:hypothetical protein